MNKLSSGYRVLPLAMALVLLNAAIISAGEVTPTPPPSLSPSIVKVDHRQLIVDGKPFIMKGVCYNPVRKGETHPAGLMTLHPTEKDLVAIEKDFKMMHEAGVNTLRTYMPLVDPRILDLLTKYQLHVIITLCDSCREGIYDLTSTIDRLKNHPSTLFWEIGNEWNYNFFYTTEKGGCGIDEKVLCFAECTRLVKDVAAFVKSQDKNHPVSTVVGNLPEDHKKEIQDLLQYVDLLGINVYDGLTLGNRLEEWKKWSSKPLYISECGADSYNELTHSYDPADQGKATRSILTEILANLSAVNKNHVLVGGCIFEWNDEWWKDSKGSPDTHTTGGFKVDKGGPYPDYFFNEEWFGVVSIDREPRPAYFVLKELFMPAQTVSKKN